MFALLVGAAAATTVTVWKWIGTGATSEDILTATATRGELLMTVSDDGELESVKSEQVSCEVEGGGKIVSIIAEGVKVKKGELVAQLDSEAIQKAINAQQVKWEQAVGKAKTTESELEVQKNKAESEIAKADLAYTLATIDFDSYEEGEYKVEYAKRNSALDLGRKELKEAEDNLEFTRGMVKKGLQQAEQLRAMDLNLQAKKFAVEQLDADLMVLKNFTRKRKRTELKAKAEDANLELARTKKSQEAATQKAESELASAKSTAEIEKVELDRLKAQLDKCKILASNDGIVMYVNARRWDSQSQIRAGAQLHFQQPIFSIPDLDKLQVKAKIHESTIKRVKMGQEATIQLSALPGKILTGKVIKVGTVAADDNWASSIKEYETTVSIDNLPADAGLRPGMSASVKIMLGSVKDAVTAPVQAISEMNGKHVAYVVKNGVAEPREVEIGESNVQFIEVKKGLAPGEAIALDARKRASAAMKTAKPDSVLAASQSTEKKEEPVAASTTTEAAPATGAPAESAPPPATETTPTSAAAASTTPPPASETPAETQPAAATES